MGGSDLRNVDYGLFAQMMTKAMHENAVDPELRDCFLPGFSTTTDIDTTVASVVMMATLKSYFDHYCVLRCGLPRVTLLGAQDDWLDIYRRPTPTRSRPHVG
jgi:hypothetical protein